MEIITVFFLIIISLSLSIFLKLIFFSPTHKLPPGPPRFPVIGNIIWLKKNSFSDFQGVLRDLASRHGPIITLHVGSKPSIWVTDRSLAHEALVQNGAVFADRPLALPTTRVITSNQHDIHSSVYGPLWRTLRRNLTSEILQPARVKAHAPSRKWALEILVDLLESEQRGKGHVSDALGHLRHAMFCLLALMCFGEKLKREEIREIEEAQYQMLISYTKFSVLNIFPSVTKFLLRRKWKEFFDLRKSQENVILRFVNARSREKAGDVLCYVDTLLGLEIPTEEEEGKKRKLSESEIVSLCSEFLNAATDPTATAMQWIMAIMVKYPEIQRKVYEEMKSVLAGEEEIREEDLGKLSYLKAVILESLRRHPPGHYLSYHKVTKDTVLGTINFMVGEMGRDPKIWEDPLTFKPERFLENGEAHGFDMTGTREIKMMPFGAGRRMCPGYSLSLLHLEYFVANLVWKFEWKCVEGEEVDLSEKQQFITMVMKTPFKANMYPRRK
ncbi:cytochrome P450 89A9 isoform X2 [Eutrema salsugineum]|uniref:cytochrome P450 89A9 isoform X2 n=1 Tax=Eutrema salsugineum TaxID=72664 RepID=UPI000CED209D|nr:cytochrome P450 89A9 isoform X2 [Eutrema salsugineum]